MSPTAKKTAKKASAKPAPRKSAAQQQTLLGAKDVAAAVDALRKAIRREFKDPAALMLLGIRTRGVVLAERLRDALSKDYGVDVPMGVLDITLYRDDLSTLGPQPMVRDSEIPHDITDLNILLVDDVLYTGRTIRAAMDEVIDFGRPARIRLAVLIDRGGREYPIQADYVGKTVKTANGGFVQVFLEEIDGKDEVVLLAEK